MDLIIPTYLLNSIYGFVWKYNHHFIFFSLALVIVDVLKTHFNHNTNSTLVDFIKREEHSIHLGACLLRYVSPTWLETPWGQRPCLPCLYYVSGSGPEPAPNRHSINTLAWKYKSPTSQSLSNKTISTKEGKTLIGIYFCSPTSIVALFARTQKNLVWTLQFYFMLSFSGV